MRNGSIKYFVLQRRETFAFFSVIIPDCSMTTKPWPTLNCNTYDVTYVSFKAPHLQNSEVSIIRENLARNMAYVLLSHISLLAEKHSAYRKQFWNLRSNSTLILNYMCQTCVGCLVYNFEYTNTYINTYIHTLTYTLRKYAHIHTCM